MLRAGGVVEADREAAEQVAGADAPSSLHEVQVPRGSNTEPCHKDDATAANCSHKWDALNELQKRTLAELQRLGKEFSARVSCCPTPRLLSVGSITLTSQKRLFPTILGYWRRDSASRPAGTSLHERASARPGAWSVRTLLRTSRASPAPNQPAPTVSIMEEVVLWTCQSTRMQEEVALSTKEARRDLPLGAALSNLAAVALPILTWLFPGQVSQPFDFGSTVGAAYVETQLFWFWIMSLVVVTLAGVAMATTWAAGERSKAGAVIAKSQPSRWPLIVLALPILSNLAVGLALPRAIFVPTDPDELARQAPLVAAAMNGLVGASILGLILSALTSVIALCCYGAWRLHLKRRARRVAEAIQAA